MTTAARTPAKAGLSAAALGPGRRQALRALLSALGDQGWQDQDGAAVAILAALEKAGEAVSAKRAAQAVPTGFLVRNRTTRTRVAQVLAALADSR